MHALSTPTPGTIEKLNPCNLLSTTGLEYLQGLALHAHTRIAVDADILRHIQRRYRASRYFFPCAFIDGMPRVVRHRHSGKENKGMTKWRSDSIYFTHISIEEYSYCQLCRWSR